MHRPIVTIPPGVLRLTVADWSIDWRGQSAGEANDGSSQVVYNAFPRWAAASELFLQGATLRQWRAIRSAARGRVGLWRVIMCDPIAFSRSMVAAPADWLTTGVPNAEDVLFSTGLGYLFDPFVTASFDAPAGSDILDIDAAASGGVPPREGQIMSADHWPFLVTSVAPRGGTLYRLTVEMPLRQAVAAGDPLMMIGRGLFEAVEDGMGNAPYDAGRTARVRLDLREALNR